jgi:chromosome segregation ATPase
MKNLPILFAIAGLAGAMPVSAQDANAQRALQKAQFMLRQATSEKAELQTQVDALKQQVDKLSADLAATKTAADKSKQATEEKYGSAIAQWKQRDTRTADELNTVKQQLKQQVEQGKSLENQLKQQTNNFSVCYENNRKLYDIDKDLLARYENKGFGDVLKQREPFTGIKQVEVENLVQDYRYQLDDLKIRPDASSASEKDGGQQAKNN